MVTIEQIKNSVLTWQKWNERRIGWYENRDKKLEFYYSCRAKQCVEILEDIERLEKIDEMGEAEYWRSLPSTIKAIKVDKVGE